MHDGPICVTFRLLSAKMHWTKITRQKFISQEVSHVGWWNLVWGCSWSTFGSILKVKGQGHEIKKMRFYRMLHSFSFWKCDGNPVKGPRGQGQKLKVVGQRSRSKHVFQRFAWCIWRHLEVKGYNCQGQRSYGSRSKVTFIKVKQGLQRKASGLTTTSSCFIT